MFFDSSCGWHARGSEGCQVNSNNPFPGLRAYTRNDNRKFFGRDQWIKALSNKLSNNRFVAVIGESGSGKSSLVRAGLLPEVEAGFLKGDDNGIWNIIELQPKDTPLKQLSKALSKNILSDEKLNEWANPADHFESTLRRSSKGFEKLLKEFSHPKEEKILILVDQFEEIFTYCDDTAVELEERDIFVSHLLQASKQSNFSIYIIITMRSDFLGDCTVYDDLPQAINESQFLVPRMTIEERREAIVGPTQLYGKDIEDKVVSTLLHEMNPLKDHLPLMQHVMMRMFDLAERNNENKIAQAHYEKVGGFDNALNLHLQEIYECQTPTQQKHTIQVFSAISARLSGDRYVRRPLVIKDIVDSFQIEEKDFREAILPYRQEGNTFLSPHGQENLTIEHTLDITHEVIIREWNLLRNRVDEEANFVDKFIRLYESAEDWTIKVGDLLVGLSLENGAKWIKDIEGIRGNDEAWSKRALKSRNHNAIRDDVFEFVKSYINSSLEAQMEREHRERLMLERDSKRKESELKQSERERRRRIILDFSIAGLVICACFIIYGINANLNMESAKVDAEVKLFSPVSYDLYAIAEQRLEMPSSREKHASGLYFALSFQLGKKAIKKWEDSSFGIRFFRRDLDSVNELIKQNENICSKLDISKEIPCSDNVGVSMICNKIAIDTHEPTSLTPREWVAINSLSKFEDGKYQKICDNFKLPDKFYDQAFAYYVEDRISYFQLGDFLSVPDDNEKPDWLETLHSSSKNDLENIRSDWKCLRNSCEDSVQFSKFMETYKAYKSPLSDGIFSLIRQTLEKNILDENGNVSDLAKRILDDRALFENHDDAYKSLGGAAKYMTCQAKMSKPGASEAIYKELAKFFDGKGKAANDLGLFQEMGRTQAMNGNFKSASAWYKKFADSLENEEFIVKHYRKISEDLENENMQNEVVKEIRRDFERFNCNSNRFNLVANDNSFQ